MLNDNHLFMKKTNTLFGLSNSRLVRMFRHNMLTHKISKILATCMNYYQLINLYALRTFCFETN